MFILAKSVKGHEFLYTASTAHEVSKASAKKIESIVNLANYKLKDNETWFIHEVDKYDTAYDYAQFQKFRIRKGIVYEATY